MKKRSYPLSEVYRLLEPGPVVMISTARKGHPNVMTMSWQTMIDFEPPLVGLIISNRNHTFNILKATKECAINIPTSRIAKEVVGCGNVSGRKVDKFDKFGLTPLPASRVKAPLVGECYANLECKVVDTKLANKYNLFIVKVVKAWIDPKAKNPKTLHHNGKGVFTIDGRRIRTSSKMP
jgi:flavin reductase (DIM6/NTAB) family NADH-FMN oxidoreductase RutF